jgi:hypothetical protein
MTLLRFFTGHASIQPYFHLMLLSSHELIRSWTGLLLVQNLLPPEDVLLVLSLKTIPACQQPTGYL